MLGGQVSHAAAHPYDSERFRPFVDISRLFAKKCHHRAFPWHIAKTKALPEQVSPPASSSGRGLLHLNDQADMQDDLRQRDAEWRSDDGAELAAAERSLLG